MFFFSVGGNGVIVSLVCGGRNQRRPKPGPSPASLRVKPSAEQVNLFRLLTDSIGPF